MYDHKTTFVDLSLVLHDHKWVGGAPPLGGGSGDGRLETVGKGAAAGGAPPAAGALWVRGSAAGCTQRTLPLVWQALFAQWRRLPWLGSHRAGGAPPLCVAVASRMVVCIFS